MGIISLVLVLTAASSLVLMLSMLKIDGIVHGDLYRYGLRFSTEWAMPYWAMTTIVFGVGWFNIIVAVAFQFYVLIYGRKEAEIYAAEKEALRIEILQEPQPRPIKEEPVEAQPTEKVEEYREQEPRPEETQTVVEEVSQQEQSQTVPAEKVEEQKDQETKPAEEPQTETKETSKTEQETDQKSPEESEEPKKTVEEIPQQVGTSVL